MVTDNDLHDVAECKLGCELLRAVAECLPLLGSVDVVQADDLGLTFAKHGDCVPIRDADDLAPEGIAQTPVAQGSEAQRREKRYGYSSERETGT